MFLKLFNINILHDYYKSGFCNNLRITPTSGCEKIIRNHRLIFKNTVKGFQVLYTASDESGEALISVSDQKFTFIITACNYAELLNATDLNADSTGYNGKNVVWFKNDPVDAKLIKHKFIDYIKPSIFNFVLPFKAEKPESDEASLEVLNEKAETVLGPFPSLKPAEDKSYSKYIDFSKLPEGKYIFRVSDSNNPQREELIYISNELSKQAIFGLLEIAYQPGMLKDYDVSFTRRNSVWKYFIMNKSGIIDPDSYSLEIKDSNKEHPDPYTKTYVFNKGMEPDPVTRKSGLDTVIFTSADKIPFFESPLLNLALVKSEKTEGSPGSHITLIKHLPNPNITGIVNKNNESEIYVFI